MPLIASLKIDTRWQDMPADYVFRRPTGVHSGPFSVRRVEGGVLSPGGESDEIEIGDVTGLQEALDGKAAAEKLGVLRLELQGDRVAVHDDVAEIEKGFLQIYENEE